MRKPVLIAGFLILGFVSAQAQMPGIATATHQPYRPTLPAPGTPCGPTHNECDFIVGRTSSNPLSVAVAGVKSPLTGISTTSVTPATGALNFTINLGITNFVAGSVLQLASQSAPTNGVTATVTSYTPPNLVVNATSFQGTSAIADWQVRQHLPTGWQDSVTFLRSNSSATDWDFRGVGERIAMQTPNSFISQSLFDMVGFTASNVPFFTSASGGNIGRRYTLSNNTFVGDRTGSTINAWAAGVVDTVEYNLVTGVPSDWLNPAKYELRINSSAYLLGAGVSALSNTTGLDFICTTAGTTAAGEPAGYSTAVHGSVITDGTAVFTAQNTSHKFRYNYVQINTNYAGLHSNGVQMTSYGAGAPLLFSNNVIDMSTVIGNPNDEDTAISLGPDSMALITNSTTGVGATVLSFPSTAGLVTDIGSVISGTPEITAGTTMTARTGTTLTLSNAITGTVTSGTSITLQNVWAIPATIEYNILKTRAGYIFRMPGQGVTTGLMTLRNNYVNTNGFGPLYNGQSVPAQPFFTMTGVYNTVNGAGPLPFSWNNGGVTTTTTHAP